MLPLHHHGPSLALKGSLICLLALTSVDVGSNPLKYNMQDVLRTYVNMTIKININPYFERA